MNGSDYQLVGQHADALRYLKTRGGGLFWDPLYFLPVHSLQCQLMTLVCTGEQE